jgi:taurine--2-oxoglutarate transaminase
MVVPDSTTDLWNDPSRELQKREDAALKLIEERASDPALAIGGVFFEPITSRGVRFYRTEFLLKLRALCDRLEIPIFADEIMSGGGRTGKFFAYQHYDGFEPDYVTFGKGLIVAGVASVIRDGATRFPGVSSFSSTLSNYNEVFLKSAQILNAIRTGDYMKNATEMGQHFMARSRAAYGDSPGAQSKAMREVRGLGLMMMGYKGVNVTLHSYGGRLMPYMDITQEEIDSLFQKPSAASDPESR